ncbi:hypothetical protein Cpap_0872 [Ruminiclostridium papyrosolvens DSM 2782]|uniref:Uncharacterized protein n=1 Tax=Ruminiclostridium papyrosolvens DSM 2782 TaxID=588581 RepID=F1TH20_9FIRM|nr:hypothetical protein [Ruminiclostridium papyrosolvens]EGD46260.1 hypothetical protein Cpap_0872 [Ruminiclostridium papyrosolvens DSM 2782]WES33018.1 hypothetical protein P0092_14775 [Ruminiclostridium papyrosolvens DSM 2782]
MSILDDLIDTFAPNYCNIFDSVTVTRVSLKVNYVGININTVFESVKKFPERDKVEVKIKFTVDEVIVISKESNIQELLEKINDLHEAFLYEEIDITVDIQKPYSDQISIYNIKKFNEWILTKNYQEIMQIFSKIFITGVNSFVFICYDFDGVFATNTILFQNPSSGNLYHNNEINRQEIIENSRKICNFYNHSQYDVIPDDFNVILSNNADDKIVKLFNEIKIFLSLIYISDISDLYEDNINITLKGYKTVDYKINLSTFNYTDNQKVLYGIYRWLYNGGNVYDKSQLARNIMTLHCKYSSILELDEKTFSSITANYGLYLKENVNNYLTVKKDITTFVQSSIQEVTKAINSFTSDLKKNFFAFFSYFATLIVSSSFAKLKVEDIFTSEVTTITSCILVGSIAFLAISLFEALSKYFMMDNNIDSLKDSYSDILDPVEVQVIIEKDKSLTPNKKRFKTNLWVISIIWICMVISVFFALDYISGNQKLLFTINFIQQ